MFTSLCAYGCKILANVRNVCYSQADLFLNTTEFLKKQLLCICNITLLLCYHGTATCLNSRSIASCKQYMQFQLYILYDKPNFSCKSYMDVSGQTLNYTAVFRSSTLTLRLIFSCKSCHIYFDFVIIVFNSRS